jgi:hypothetical protein
MEFLLTRPHRGSQTASTMPAMRKVVSVMPVGTWATGSANFRGLVTIHSLALPGGNAP